MDLSNVARTLQTRPGRAELHIPGGKVVVIERSKGIWRFEGGHRSGYPNLHAAEKAAMVLYRQAATKRTP